MRISDWSSDVCSSDLSYSELTSRLHDRPPHQDRTLQHPNCVYQILKRHYARYTPEMVERTTGCPKDLFVKVADALARNSGPERTSAICYAVGWNHHREIGRASCRERGGPLV